jgi:enoyl-CoA hydratase
VDDEFEPYDVGEKLHALEVTRRGPVAVVTLLGPGKGNAMGPEFWRETPLVFRALDADDGVLAVVVSGSGRTFSYGLDLATMAGALTGPMGADGALAAPRTRLLGTIRTMQASLDAVARCRKPVAAAVHGWCIGAGVDLIAACDVRYASADARFSVREVKVAIVADMGSLQRLPAIIGDGNLRELALTGKDVDAARAKEIGLVNDVLASPEEALAAAHGFACRGRGEPAAGGAGGQGGAGRLPVPGCGGGTAACGDVERGLPAVPRPERGGGGVRRTPPTEVRGPLTGPVRRRERSTA